MIRTGYECTVIIAEKESYIFSLLNTSGVRNPTNQKRKDFIVRFIARGTPTLQYLHILYYKRLI